VAGGVYALVEYANLAPGTDPDERLMPSDILNAVVGILQLLMAIFLGVIFLRWIFRVNKNLHILSAERMAFTPGWSVGWYFIPFGNLFKPYQAMKEIWSVAHRGTSNYDPILTRWWCLWLLSNLLGRVAFRLAFRAKDVGGYIHSAVAYIISDALDIFLSVAALTLVAAIAQAYATNYSEQDSILNPHSGAGGHPGLTGHPQLPG
jgi:hypothetical protein